MIPGIGETCTDFVKILALWLGFFVVGFGALGGLSLAALWQLGVLG